MNSPNSKYPIGHFVGISFKYAPGVQTVMEALPYETEDLGNTVYMRYTDGIRQKDLRGNTEKVKEVILRKTVDGNITRWEKTIDFWENRASATYVPINSTALAGLEIYG